MSIDEVARLLERLGCPPHKSGEMAAQLDKRARQLAAEQGRPCEDAQAHLLKLMAQGWAASGGPRPPEPEAN